MAYCQLNFGKKKLEILPFLGGLGADFHILAHWPQKGYKLRHHGLLRVLNTFLALSYPGKTDYDNKPYVSLRFL